MRSLISIEDAMGYRSSAINVSDTVFAVVLAAGVSKQVTVPTDARKVLFSATGTFWAKFGEAAILPVGDMLNGNAPELNPVAREIKGGIILGLVAPASTIVNLIFYG